MVISRASSKLLSLKQDRPSKIEFFWSNPYKIKYIKTAMLLVKSKLPPWSSSSLAGVEPYPLKGAIKLEFESHKKLFTDIVNRNYDVITFSFNIEWGVLRQPKVINFCGISKNVVMLIAKAIKESVEVKKIRKTNRIHVFMYLYLHFSIYRKLQISVENPTSAELKLFLTWCINLWISFD